MALIAVVAFAVAGPSGSLVDRLGARMMLILGTSCLIIGLTVLAFATSVPMFAVGFVLLGISMGISWPAFNTLISAITSGTLRQQYFGVNFAMINLGIGVGGIIGGFFVDVATPVTFTIIFLANAASMLLPLILFLGPLRHVRTQPAQSAEMPTVTYGELLRRPAVLWLALVTFICTLVGYGQLESGVPVFARQVAEVSTRDLGIAFAVNTFVIVAFQFAAQKRMIGRSRTTMLLALVATWIGAWLVLGSAGLLAGTVLAAIAVAMFMGVLGIGEILMQSAVPALVNDLAEDRARGRANAINSAAYQGGAVLGPVIAGVLLQRQLYAGFLVTMIGLLLVMAGAVRALRGRLTPAENGIPAGVSARSERLRQ